MRTSQNAVKAKFLLPHSPGPEGLPCQGHDASGGYYPFLMYHSPRSVPSVHKKSSHYSALLRSSGTPNSPAKASGNTLPTYSLVRPSPPFLGL